MQRLRAQLAHLNARMAASAMGVAVAFGGVKNGLADLIIQHAVEQRPLGQTDWKRLNVFVTFGLLYVGGVQFILFNRLMPRMFKGLLEGRRAAAVKATIFDQGVHMPFGYLPVFYAMRELGTTDASFATAISDGVDAYKSGVVDDMLLQYQLFVPTQLLNFTVVPPHLRVPVLTSVGFVWCMALSFRHGNKAEGDRH